MKMPQEHVERIAALGYTESEARFLYLVATHSGYFTLRHFSAFAGVHPGQAYRVFLAEAAQARSCDHARLHGHGIGLSSLFPAHLRTH